MIIQKELKKLADKEKAKILQRFFKTAKGQYGEGDLFLGVTVPQMRNLVKLYWKEISLDEIKKILDSKFHEERLTYLLILVKKYENSDDKQKWMFVKFYLKNLKKINNWDLVDLTAPNILGNFLLDRDRKILYKLVKSKNLWEKRISIISTFSFIRKNKFEDTLRISKILLQDKHDLIHKAVGWMLREVGKRDMKVLERFLEENYRNLPRTALRYAIEKMQADKRMYYLTKQ